LKILIFEHGKSSALLKHEDGERNNLSKIEERIKKESF
jgi:hypothetical protein